MRSRIKHVRKKKKKNGNRTKIVFKINKFRIENVWYVLSFQYDPAFWAGFGKFTLNVHKKSRPNNAYFDFFRLRKKRVHRKKKNKH